MAVQSSGSENAGEGKSEIQQSGGDMADSPPSPDRTAYTRHEPNAFTALSHHDQASAWC